MTLALVPSAFPAVKDELPANTDTFSVEEKLSKFDSLNVAKSMLVSVGVNDCPAGEKTLTDVPTAHPEGCRPLR